MHVEIQRVYPGHGTAQRHVPYRLFYTPCHSVRYNTTFGLAPAQLPPGSPGANKSFR